jgi:biotin carboxyl carrier protein
MYKVKANEGEDLKIEITDKEIFLEGKKIEWDQVEIGKNRFHILKNNHSYICEVISADAQKKSFEIKVNGKILRVAVKDRFDELLHQLGMDKASVNKVNVIKAPMPGLVLKLIAKEGDEIKTGDSLLILEAMKMENVIKSGGEGKIKHVRVSERDAVEKNQVLIELE